MFYEQPFNNIYGEHFDWLGVCHLADSKVMHAWVTFHRPHRFGVQLISQVVPTGNDLCYSGVHFAQPRSRRRFRKDADMSEVTCKKCLRIMRRTAIMKDVAWEV